MHVSLALSDLCSSLYKVLIQKAEFGISYSATTADKNTMSLTTFELGVCLMFLSSYSASFFRLYCLLLCLLSCIIKLGFCHS